MWREREKERKDREEDKMKKGDAAGQLRDKGEEDSSILARRDTQQRGKKEGGKDEGRRGSGWVGVSRGEGEGRGGRGLISLCCQLCQSWSQQHSVSQATTAAPSLRSREEGAGGGGGGRGGEREEGRRRTTGQEDMGLLCPTGGGVEHWVEGSEEGSEGEGGRGAQAARRRARVTLLFLRRPELSSRWVGDARSRRGWVGRTRSCLEGRVFRCRLR